MRGRPVFWHPAPVAEIRIDPLGGGTFHVVVDAGGTRTEHRVRLPDGLFERLGVEGVTPEAIVRASFEFLLEREPASSILAEFDLDVIGRYFPDWEADLRRRLRA